MRVTSHFLFLPFLAPSLVNADNKRAQDICAMDGGYKKWTLLCLSDVSYTVCNGTGVGGENEAFVPIDYSCVPGTPGYSPDVVMPGIATATRQFTPPGPKVYTGPTATRNGS